LIIMLLIQAGGIGILSFAGLFSYFLKGGSSYENQLTIGGFSNTKQMSEVFDLLKHTVLITFGIELVGALAIYSSIGNEIDGLGINKLFFSLFHAVSSFCNAGFSLLPEGLMNKTVVFNYNLQLIIAFIYVFGGLGFPIVVNILTYLKHIGNRLIGKWTLKKNLYR